MTGSPDDRNRAPRGAGTAWLVPRLPGPGAAQLDRALLVRFQDHLDASRLRRQTYTLAEFLVREREEWDPPARDGRGLPWARCRGRSIMGTDAHTAEPFRDALRGVAGRPFGKDGAGEPGDPEASSKTAHDDLVHASAAEESRTAGTHGHGSAEHEERA